MLNCVFHTWRWNLERLKFCWMCLHNMKLVDFVDWVSIGSITEPKFFEIPCKYPDFHEIVIWYYDITKLCLAFFLEQLTMMQNPPKWQISNSNFRYQARIVFQISFSYCTIWWCRIISWLHIGNCMTKSWLMHLINTTFLPSHLLTFFALCLVSLVLCFPHFSFLLTIDDLKAEQ